MNDIMLRFTGLMSTNRQGQTWVQDPVSGHYHELDQVGCRICQLLKTPMTEAALIAALTEEYEVSPAQCRADVAPFLAKLKGCGLLKEGRA